MQGLKGILKIEHTDKAKSKKKKKKGKKNPLTDICVFDTIARGGNYDNPQNNVKIKPHLQSIPISGHSH